MRRYAFVVLPAFNRVYGEASVRLSASELAVFSETALACRVGEIEETRMGGVPYLTFTAPELSEQDVAFLANLSSIYALFAVEGSLLRPLELRPLDRFSSDLITILKYPGKTNEHFTKLLLNVTLLSRAEPQDMLGKRLAVLDPLCGRGTTMNQAMMYGHDVAGVEIDGKDFDAYSRFIQTWLKNKRLKHSVGATSVSRNRAGVGRRLDVEFALSKEAFTRGDASKISFVNADTLKAREFFRPATFDLVVTDAPYGVQHGSQETESRLSRRPLQLLGEAVPIWVELLRPGGALGISWNTYVARRQDLAEILLASGLEVPSSGAYLGFSHRVDQAIIRDLIVGRKPPA
jgi:SAM-dependent methyltransferase